MTIARGVRDQERIDRVCDALRRAQFAAIVCARPSNVRLLSGYWPIVGASIAICSVEGHVSLVVPEDEAEPAALGWADTIRTFSPGSLDAIAPLEDVVRPALTEAFQHLDLGAGRIACEDGPVPEPASYAATYQYGPALPRLLRTSAPGSQITVDEALLAALRSVLTAREREILRSACRTAAGAFAATAKGLSAGMTEIAVADRLRLGLDAVDLESSRRAGGFAFCMAGAHSARASAAYQRSQPTPIADGDLVLLHCNSYVDGIWTDITRTFALSRMTTRNRLMFEAVFEARQAALAAVRPGATGRDVDTAARRVLDRHGLGTAFRHATGHGVGFAAIDHSAIPRLHPASDDVLEDGMVFNVEPAAYVDGYGGVRHCDVVALVNGRAEVLTAFQDHPVIIC